MATYTLVIPNWKPISVNALTRTVKDRIRLKRFDREMIVAYAWRQRLAPAEGRRRVSARFVVYSGPLPDSHNLMKSLLDALVHAGLLLDDSDQWLELGPWMCEHGDEPRTEITLEDLS